MNETPDGGEEIEDMLIADLRKAAAAREPVPPSVVEAARAAFSWRLVDAELAELVADSAFDSPLVGVRGSQESRLITFEVPGGTALELEASPAGDGMRVVGQVVPPRSGTAHVVHPGGSVAVDVDEVGRFAAQGILHGPMRVRLRLVVPTAGGMPDTEIVTASLNL